MLAQTAGIEKADSLSIEHIDLALQRLLQLEKGSNKRIFDEINKVKEVNLRALVGLALKVKTRNN